MTLECEAPGRSVVWVGGAGGGRFEGTAYDELVGGANVGAWEVADTEGTSYASFILTVGFFPPRR